MQCNWCIVIVILMLIHSAYEQWCVGIGVYTILYYIYYWPILVIFYSHSIMQFLFSQHNHCFNLFYAVILLFRFYYILH